MRRLLVEFVRLCRGVGGFAPDNGSGSGGLLEGGGVNADVGRGDDGSGTLPVPGTVSFPVSPWVGTGASHDRIGMEMGLAASTMEQQVDGMVSTAGFDFMAHDDPVFSF
jgi:hypothetical protein